MNKETTWMDEHHILFQGDKIYPSDRPSDNTYYYGSDLAVVGIPILICALVFVFGKEIYGDGSSLVAVLSALGSLPITYLLFHKLPRWLKKQKKLKQQIIDKENEQIEKKR